MAVSRTIPVGSPLRGTKHIQGTPAIFASLRDLNQKRVDLLPTISAIGDRPIFPLQPWQLPLLFGRL